ncbi:MAG: PA14 domain-containing protein [Tepidisphaeraceae bacterium]
MEQRQLLTASGLRAYYYNNETMTGEPVTRVDPTLNFKWGLNAPTAGIAADHFSAVWSGQVTAPTSGTYTFYYTTNNFGRLWIDNQLVVNNWKSHGDTTDVASIELVAGQSYDFRAEFADATSDATVRLEWLVPGEARTVVPAGVLTQNDDAAPGPYASFNPGSIWLDTDGNPINAHGGSVTFVDGVYYWYGEQRRHDPSVGTANSEGISVYSSTDLLNWTYNGLVLSSATTTNSDLAFGRVIERPRVVYNDATNQYVMWLHIDSPDYAEGKAGVAVSRSPTGPFTYLGSVRPMGFDSRDLTLFKDPDTGKAYLVFASDWNSALRMGELNSDYTGFTGRSAVIRGSTKREAPAIVKVGDTYQMITSGATMWLANAAEMFSATNMLGPWTSNGNPMTGPLASTTNNAQVERPRADQRHARQVHRHGRPLAAVESARQPLRLAARLARRAVEADDRSGRVVGHRRHHDGGFHRPERRGNRSALGHLDPRRRNTDDLHHGRSSRRQEHARRRRRRHDNEEEKEEAEEEKEKAHDDANHQSTVRRPNAAAGDARRLTRAAKLPTTTRAVGAGPLGCTSRRLGVDP